MISGIGSKNLNHPHHRAANPELRNSFSEYDYRHLVGALAGGNTPSESLYVESAKDYLHSEVGINGTTNILIPVIGLSIAEQKVHVRPIANMGRTLRTSLQIIPLRSSGALLVKSGKPMRSIALYTISGRVVERKVFSDKCPLSVQLQTDRDRIAGNELYVIRVLFNNGEIVGKKIATMTR
jgi:hypothetical protein